jgi:hypothetical protein
MPGLIVLVFGFAQHLTAGSNPLQFIRNERRERVLVAAQPAAMIA